MTKLLTHVFSSLSVRNFRLFAAGQLVSAAGSWMMVVVQDWLVLGLADNSGPALGAVTALQFTPVLLLTLYGGRLADRYDRRMLLTVANLAAGVLALMLSLLVFAHEVRLWHVYVLALGLGIVNAVEVPTRLAFVSEMAADSRRPGPARPTRRGFCCDFRGHHDGLTAGFLRPNRPGQKDMVMTESSVLSSLRVERGNPSPEEMAALIAVLLTRGAADAGPTIAAEPAPTARWRRPERVYIFDAPRVWRAYERVGG